MEKSLTVSAPDLPQEKRMLTDSQPTKSASHSASLSETAQLSKAGISVLQVCKQAASAVSSSQQISHTAKRESREYRAIRSLSLI